MAIKLNLINKSNDTNQTEFLMFQKNVATSIDETIIAWKVVKYLGYADYHPFTYDTTLQVSSQDSWGNFTPRLKANQGDAFHMVLTNSGNELLPNGQSSSSTEVEIKNDLTTGSVNASVFRSGTLVSKKTGVSPGQKAIFAFKPTLFIGAVSQVEQGDVVDSAIVTSVNTELSLMGIASADIVITGGGTGPTATAFEFNLENVVMA